MQHTLMNGHLTIHSAPSALRQHIEWGINSLLGSPQNFMWRDQPLAAGTSRTSLEFRAPRASAAKIATALKNWYYLRFEVHELDQGGGELFRCTPELGIHRATLDAAGNIQVSENQISKALSHFDDLELRENLELALGKPWDLALEPYRGVDLQEVARLRAI
jgi:uncharacterized protein YfdQ (DUF2303 family)